MSVDVRNGLLGMFWVRSGAASLGEQILCQQLTS